MNAIAIETAEYETAHGKRPRGFGMWAFRFRFYDAPSQLHFVPRSMAYSDAVKWAREAADQLGAFSVSVAS